MESVDPFDKYIDPPDEPEPEMIECDGCGYEIVKDRATKNKQWYFCDDCAQDEADDEGYRLSE
jgi:hypothetical protein